VPGCFVSNMYLILVTGSDISAARGTTLGRPRKWLLADGAVDALPEQVGVTVMPGVLLDHVLEHLPQRDGLTRSRR
jgi:tagatose-1,6-bisphosphate aldolase non-catalytic subunit AgaZ/GatZ